MSRKSKDLHITFHNPNDLEVTATFLSTIIVDTLVEEALENPKTFFDFMEKTLVGEKN